MYRTIKTIQKVKFPVYSLPSNNFDVIDGIAFVDGSALDDRNMRGETIGIRRLQSKRKDLYKLRTPLFNLGDLIGSKKNHFISSCGKMFTYEKTGFQKIKYLPIQKFELRNTFSFVYASGISIPFEIPRPPADYDTVPWVRILYYENFPWMVYGFSKKQGRDTRIKV